ncbi:hypothetical protein C0989_006044 [Termitomyces sp. Mn162]|nr:hypothetical protein C0989_006044 [Termitomyces sp. Mn162]
MSQLANSDTPLEALAPQDKAWTHLLHLETQVQLMQSSLTYHTTKLSTLCQTTDLISQSLQALLKCLTPTPTPPLAVEPAPTASALIPIAPVTLQPQIPCSTLPDAYDGVGSFPDWATFKKDFHAEFFLLDPTKTMALTLCDREQYGQGKHMLDEYIDSFWALVEQAAYPNGL